MKQVAHRIVSSKGIAIMSELDAVASHKFNHTAIREMLRSLESHMLYEMCDTLFFVVLHH